MTSNSSGTTERDHRVGSRAIARASCACWTQRGRWSTAGDGAHDGRGSDDARCASYAGARVVLEVGTHSPWVSRQLTQQGYEVVVANPGRVRRIGGVVTDKSDRHRRGAAWRGSGVRTRRCCGRSSIAASGAAGSRAAARARSAWCARGRGSSLQARGHRQGARRRGCRAAMRSRSRQRMAPRRAARGVSRAGRRCCEVVAALTQQVKALDADDRARGARRYPETARLRQVTGVGPITALAYVRDARGSAARSRAVANVGPYLGLRPKRYQSGHERSARSASAKAGDAVSAAHAGAGGAVHPRALWAGHGAATLRRCG